MALGRLAFCARGLMSRKVDLSENITLSQSFLVQDRCFFFYIQKASHFLTILAVRRGFLAAHLEGNPSLFWHMCWIVLTEMSAKPGTSPLTSLAVLKRWRRIKRRSLSSCAKFVFRGLLERFLGSVRVADSGRSLWIRMFFTPYQHSARAFPQSPSA